MTALRHILSALLLIGALNASAQTGPQDNWVFDSGKTWDTETIIRSEGIAVGDGKVFVCDGLGEKEITAYDIDDGSVITNFGAGMFSEPRGMAYHSGKLFVVEAESMIKVFTADGAAVTNWGSSGNADGEFYMLRRVAADDDYIYTVEGGKLNEVNGHRVQVFTHDGDFVRKWGTYGNEAPGQFIIPCGIAVDRQHVYVSDSYALQNANRRIQVFDKQGRFIRAWEIPPIMPGGAGPYVLPFGLAVDDNNVYLTGYLHDSYGNRHGNNKVYVFDKYGKEVYSHFWTDWDDTYEVLNDVAVANPYVYVTTGSRGLIRAYRRVYRTLGELELNAPPLGSIKNIAQREGTLLLDIDYVVSDPDDTNLTVYAAAYMIEPGSYPSLDNLVPMHSFIEGSETNLGGGIKAEKTYRLSWDMGADGVEGHISDYGNLSISLLVRDDRDLLDLHFLHLPALGTNPAVVINRSPLLEKDFLPAWHWWLASSDTNIYFSTGTVSGTTGAYDGQVLATGTNTTARGREYLFSRLGYREATPSELQHAREATSPGSVIKRSARQEPPNENYKVNEFNFVTDPTNGWWVVPLP